MAFGDGNTIVDWGIKAMNVDADKWIALQAIHGAVHAIHIGEKYTWFGNGYISNFYFKMIANKPTYTIQNGQGDLSFTSCIKGNGARLPYQPAAFGGVNGEPVANNGW